MQCPGQEPGDIRQVPEAHGRAVEKEIGSSQLNDSPITGTKTGIEVSNAVLSKQPPGHHNGATDRLDALAEATRQLT